MYLRRLLEQVTDINDVLDIMLNKYALFKSN